MFLEGLLLNIKLKIMKKELLTLFLAVGILCLSISSYAQLPNTGFESWATGPGGYLDPVGWTTNSDIANFQMVQQAPGHTGTYCAQLNYKPLSTIPWDGGVITFNSGPTALKPQSFTGWWKTVNHSFAAQLVSHVTVWDANSSVMGSGVAYTNSISGNPNWTQFTVNVGYSNNNAVGFFEVDVWCEPPASPFYGFVDDVNLTYVTGLEENASSSPVQASYIAPNNHHSHDLHLLSSENFSARVRIMDVEGRELYNHDEQLTQGRQVVTLPTAEFKDGLYFCVIDGKSFANKSKFVIAH